MPPLDWLRTFEAAARHENFTEAADELGLTQAAVSQQIRKLEAHFKITLFHRLARGVELTAEGDAYLPSVRSAIHALARSTEDLFGKKGSKVITIACPASIASLWLVPRLQWIIASRPKISLSVAAIHRPADYEAIKADIEIRFGNGKWEGKIATHLFSEVLSPICAPSLLVGVPEGKWQSLPCIRLAGRRSGWSEWAIEAKMSPPRKTAIRFDSFITALDAAKAGVGVLLASLPLSERALAQQEVVRLSPVELAMPIGNWLVRNPEVQMRAEVEELCRLISHSVASDLPF
ncbi:LysR family transcriptional regulator [Kiloniella laminariae]|uniref:LysR family transcriptional regulator n=1 Tax=Kiloniella laminariae TaxID=454162 RepID=A0ABT4LHW8_9PROT|nr:LysR family transcriptional regulator [Kiloniella laminariae]MCZ4280698.1 LysR family transcriptional regulator [Kiloniella laminariae]